MRSFWSDNRRKLPVVNMILSVSFTAALITMTFWISSIEVRVQNNSTLQKSVLESNVEFNRECKNIKKDMEFIREQLSVIQSVLIKND